MPYKLMFERLQKVQMPPRKWWQFWKPHTVAQLCLITVGDIQDDEVVYLQSSDPNSPIDRLLLRLMMQGGAIRNIRVERQ